MIFGSERLAVLLLAISLGFGSAVSARAQGEFPPPPPPGLDGLIAHYPLDGTGADSGSRKLDGEVVGATPTTDRFGNARGALHFNGISDHVNLGDRPEFNFAESFTINLWVQLTRHQPRTYILGKYYSTGPLENASHSYGIGTDEYGAAYGFVLGDGVFYTDLRPGTVLADTRWHSVSLVYDRSFGVKIYVDGRMVSSAPAPGLPPFINDYPLLIGQIASGQFFAGNIDDVSLFDRALADNEIQALYRSQSAGEPVPLQNATGTFSQTDSGDFSVGSMIDGIITDNRGWSIYPNFGNQTAVFETTQDVGTPGGTALTFSLLFNVISVPGTTGHTLGRFRLSVTTDPRDTFADQFPSGGDVTANWTPVEVTSATTQSGAAITKLADGSLLVSGQLQEEDLYTVVATTPLVGITGIRLEALTDPSLPFGGPGREPLNGNFSVSEFVVSARPLVPIVDQTRPFIVVSSPTQRRVQSSVVRLEGVITDNVGIASATWMLNGVLEGSLMLQNGRFSVNDVPLVLGTNTLQVLAIDTSGNRSSIEITVLRKSGRLLLVGATAPFQEGERVVVPIQLDSRGEVAGVTFDLGYDAFFLQTPEIIWGAAVQSGLLEVNTNVTGVIRASFALTGITMPRGNVKIADVVFHAGSVPQSLETQLALSAPGIVSVTGDPLFVGTDILSGSVRLNKRKFTGDNNGNDRLDVGDASEIMRLVNQFTLARPWDVPSNDLNGNQQLDIGDVIRVLRAVVGLDPQPSSGVSAAAERMHALDDFDLGPPLVAIPAPPSAWLSLSEERAVAGEKITLRVHVSPGARTISGASFTVRYPVEGLRLENANSHQTIGFASGGSVTVWNVSPKQNDYEAQDGAISVAVSGSSDWHGTDGAIAEFTFTVQNGVTNQYLWPIELTNVELSDGSDVFGVLGTEIWVSGRDSNAPNLRSTFDGGNGKVAIKVSGEPNVQYRVDVSDDLKSWTQLTIVVSERGTLTISEPIAPGAKRFYRALQLSP